MSKRSKPRFYRKISLHRIRKQAQIYKKNRIFGSDSDEFLIPAAEIGERGKEESRVREENLKMPSFFLSLEMRSRAEKGLDRGRGWVRF